MAARADDAAHEATRAASEELDAAATALARLAEAMRSSGGDGDSDDVVVARTEEEEEEDPGDSR